MRGASLDLKRRILDRVGSPGAGVWTPVDFLDLGGRAAIDKALQRLVADDDLRRIDRGLYDRPPVNKLTKAPAAPSTQAVIDAIARRDQARLLVDGMTAANDLGLTTAVPAQVVVLTDARLKPVQLGAQQIRFKQAAPSRLYWAGRPAMRLVQALFWLQDVLPSDRDAILRRLGNLIVWDPKGGAIAADLQAGLSAMPIWMQSIARDLVAQAHDAGLADDDHLRTGRDHRHADDGDRARANRHA
jgi:hypothetical protein